MPRIHTTQVQQGVTRLTLNYHPCDISLMMTNVTGTLLLVLFLSGSIISAVS